MSSKDILVIVTSQAGGEHVVALAEHLAASTDGRLTVALVNWMPRIPDEAVRRLIEERRQREIARARVAPLPEDIGAG